MLPWMLPQRCSTVSGVGLLGAPWARQWDAEIMDVGPEALRWQLRAGMRKLGEGRRGGIDTLSVDLLDNPFHSGVMRRGSNAMLHRLFNSCDLLVSLSSAESLILASARCLVLEDCLLGTPFCFVPLPFARAAN